METYESWDFCKYHVCDALRLSDKDKRKRAYCETCRAYQMHQYLKDHGQILEEGSELEQMRSNYEKCAEILGDMVDVAEVTGSAYLYRRDVGPIKDILAQAKAGDKR